MTEEPQVKSRKRWLKGWVILLCLAILANGILITWIFVESGTRSNADAQQIEENQDAIVLLCDRGYILNDIIISLRNFAEQNNQLNGVDAFVQSLELNYAQVLDQLTSEDSPCVKALP